MLSVKKLSGKSNKKNYKRKERIKSEVTIARDSLSHLTHTKKDNQKLWVLRMMKQAYLTI